MTEKTKKRISASLFLAGVVFFCLIAYLVGRPMVQFVSDPRQFQLWVESRGLVSRLIFVGMMTFQVLVAIIPGEALEIGAGYAFGAVEGTLLCMVGITLGSVIIFLLVRRFGIRFVELFFSMEKIHSLKFLQNERHLNMVAFFVFLVPGTPKDLLSYFVGLTKMKLSTWLWITTIARIPSILTSTIGGNALGGEHYGAALLVFGVTALLSLAGFWLYTRWSKEKNR